MSWGIDVIAGMQSRGGPLLDGFFRGITFLGNEEFYLLLFPLFFWCLDARLGSKLVYLLLVGGLVNYVLKDVIAQPRPFFFQPGINMVEAGGYGLPSGHAQMAVVIWGCLALELGKRWAWLAALVLVPLIGVSRVYLGVHFPTDVLAGWAVGAVILVLVVRIGPGVARWIGGLSLPAALLLIGGLSILALLLDHSKDMVSSVAAFWGFALGHLFLSRSFSQDTTGSLWRRIARFPIGLAGLAAVYIGLKALFPAEGESLYLVFRFARYALLGLWIGLAAPLLFRLLRLHSNA
ncbi:MAG: phosphatase PAP2 family protein [Spirochaetales bacterium]|nr:phosphatase PAP2 family protein [Spirochaetales bacterium]